MKRKLKITYGQLEATQERVSVFRNALENMDSAIEMSRTFCQNSKVMRSQHFWRMEET